MENWILSKILKFIGGKLNGYKTYIGIGMKALAGLLGVLQSMYPDLAVAIPHNAVDSVDQIGNTVMLVGGTHKIAKLHQAVISPQGQAVAPSPAPGLPPQDAEKPQDGPEQPQGIGGRSNG
jgi:hypothetical protein